MAVLVVRKISVLNGLTFVPTENTGLASKIKDKILNGNSKGNLSAELFLHKFLSKVKIIILRSENKINFWLSKLRQKSLTRKNNFSEDYWQKLKRKN
jgi:hypothetical protein